MDKSNIMKIAIRPWLFDLISVFNNQKLLGAQALEEGSHSYLPNIQIWYAKFVSGIIFYVILMFCLIVWK